MIPTLRIPIRFKILLLLLLAVSLVLGLITFTMARLFHQDKMAYIHDITSVIALHTAEEARSLLVGYQERLQVFAELMADDTLPAGHKEEMLKRLFENFREFVLVTLYEDGVELGTVWDMGAVESKGLTRDDFSGFREENPLPFEQILQGEVYVENSTFSPSFPVLTIAVPLRDSEEDKTVIAAAVVRLDQLLRLARRSRVFETFLLDGGGTLLAHTDPELVGAREKVPWTSGIRELRQGHSLGFSTEYLQGDVPMIGGLAKAEFSGVLSGVQIPKAAAYLTARELLGTLVALALLLLVSAALLSLFFSRRITRPIERLSEATRQVAKGDFDVRIALRSGDEIGELSASFNQMAAELKTRELALRDAQAALVQSEKMAAFGQLGAGIAHEVKNPLAGILGYAQLSLRKVESGSTLEKNLQVIEKETKRCKTIIDNLMKFARQEKVEHLPMEINRVVEDACAIVDHQLGINKVRLEKDLAPALPLLRGNGNQIQQVLMNLMINAQQAMEKGGSVTVRTLPVPQGVEIRVRDTGPGIPPEIRAKIFEPFFTTKPAGKGTGLGLSVSYGIIKDHRGDICVEEAEGGGTEFVITLPVPSPSAAQEKKIA